MPHTENSLRVLHLSVHIRTDNSLEMICLSVRPVLTAQAYFCDTRSPLRGLPLTAPLPLTQFSAIPLTLRSMHMLSLRKSQPCYWFSFHNN